MTNDNDPLGRLGGAFRQVPAPDQWNDIVARAQDSAGVGGRAAASRSTRHAWGWLAAAAAAVVALVGGLALLRDGEPGAPVGTQPGDAVPAPVPALPCTNASDLAAVVELLGSGTENLAYGQHSALYLLGSGAHAVLVADVASVARVDEWRRLELSGTPTYVTGEGPVDAISERAPWDASNGADPLAVPRHLHNVRVAAAVHSLSSAPVWSPGLGELIVGCAGVDVPAIDMHNGMTLFGDPSVDEIAELMSDPEGAPPVPSAPSTAPLTAPAPSSPTTTPTATTPPSTSPDTTTPPTTSAPSTPPGTPTVLADWGDSAQGQAGCSAPTCRYLSATGAGFESGSTVAASCWGDNGGEWYRFSSNYELTVEPDGSVALDDMCYFGFDGSHAKVVIDGVESNVLTSGE